MISIMVWINVPIVRLDEVEGREVARRRGMVSFRPEALAAVEDVDDDWPIEELVAQSRIVLLSGDSYLAPLSREQVVRGVNAILERAGARAALLEGIH